MNPASPPLPPLRTVSPKREASLLHARAVLARAQLAYRSARPKQGNQLMYLLGAHLGEVEPSGIELQDEGLWRLRAAVVGPRLTGPVLPGAVDRYFEQLRIMLEDQLERC